MAARAREDAAAAALALRKRPLQARSAQTVETLIEAAAQVLEADGLAGFNTNAVAARAGVSVGSLYQYFHGKDALMLALMKRESNLFVADATVALAQANGRDALLGFIDAAVRQQLVRPRLARLLDLEEGRPDLQRVLDGGKDVRRRLEAVLKRGDLPRPSQPRIAALDLAAIVRGLTDGAGLRGESDSAALRRRIVAAVFGYLDRMAAEAPPRTNASKGSPARRMRSTSR